MTPQEFLKSLLEQHTADSLIAQMDIENMKMLYKLLLPKSDYVPETKEKCVEVFMWYNKLLFHGIQLSSFNKDELLTKSSKEIKRVYFTLFNSAKQGSDQELAELISSYFNRKIYYELYEGVQKEEPLSKQVHYVECTACGAHRAHLVLEKRSNDKITSVIFKCLECGESIEMKVGN